MAMDLPPGFIFKPTDEELLTYYLKPQIKGEKLSSNLIKEKEIYGPNANPWEIFNDSSTSWIISGMFVKTVYVFARLTKKALSCSTGINKKKSSGVGREQYVKKAGCGTWDGKTRRKQIMDIKGENVIGMKRMLVFEINDISGLRDHNVDLNKVGYWKMHEYCLCGYEDYVLCQITLDRSKNANVVSLCPKVVARCSDSKVKADNKTGSEVVVMIDPSDKEVVPIQDIGLIDDNNIVQGEGNYNYGLVNENLRGCQEENNWMMTDENMLALTSCVCSDQGIVNKWLPQIEEQGWHVLAVNDEHRLYCEETAPIVVNNSEYIENILGTEVLSDFSSVSKDDVYLDLEDLFDSSSWSEKDIEDLFEEAVDNNKVLSDFSSMSKDDVYLDVEDLFDSSSWSEKDMEDLFEEVLDNKNVHQQQLPVQNMSCSQVLGKRKSFEAQEYCSDGSKKLSI